MFDGRSGTTATPAASSGATQSPVEPSFGQLAPPSASTTASGRSSRSPSGVSNRIAPSSLQPVQRERVRSSTPKPFSRASQARSRGEAFIARGNTRPLDPVKVAWPRPSAQAVNSSGENASSHGDTAPAALPYRPSNAAWSSEWVRFSPPRPAISSLRPGDGIRSCTVTIAPACASRSAAISPAGPAPTMWMVFVWILMARFLPCSAQRGDSQAPNCCRHPGESRDPAAPKAICSRSLYPADDRVALARAAGSRGWLRAPGMTTAGGRTKNRSGNGHGSHTLPPHECCLYP